tara:strand:- start:44 stop:544 length:501 start_codon:yes stop_codon:yes gene_type:complete
MFSYLIRKPILSIGILFFIIFLFQLQKSGYFEKRRKVFSAASCTAVVVKLKKIVKSNWSLECKGHFAERTDTLEVTINQEIPITNKKITPKAFVYREMANHLSFIAKNSPIDNLERLSWLKISIVLSSGQADGVISGELLSKMSTLKTQEGLMGHLKNSVNVKDNF